MVPKGGLEPPRVAPHAPQTCASASSATSAMRGRSIPLPRATDKPPDPLPQAWVERVANPLAQEVVREDRDEDRESRVHGQPPADLDRVLALVEDVAPGRVRRLDAEPEERQARLGQDSGGDARRPFPPHRRPPGSAGIAPDAPEAPRAHPPRPDDELAPFERGELPADEARHAH